MIYNSSVTYMKSIRKKTRKNTASSYMTSGKSYKGGKVSHSEKENSYGKSGEEEYKKEDEEAIILQDHQVNAIYHLLTEKNHGMLVWHMMGTGKTITGLVAILNYPKKTINIICPRDLVFVWKSELKKMPEITNKIHFFSYEEYDDIILKSWDDEIIILDEAHHLVTIMRNSPTNAAIINKKFNAAFRILALTGTPIYRDLVDLVYLINVCAGKEVMPYNVSEFRKKYAVIKKTKSVVYGYIYPLIKIFGVLQILKIIQTLPYVVNIGLSAPTYKKQFLNAVHVVPIPTRDQLQAFKQIHEVLHDKKKNGDKYVKNNLIAYVDVEKIDYNLLANDILPKLTDIGSSMNNDFNNILFLSCTFMLLYILSTIVCIETLDDYSKINVQEIANDIEKYTSYHTIVHTSTSEFPQVIHHKKKVSYNMYQMMIWMDMTRGCLPEDIVERLSLENAENAKYYSKKLDLESYLTNGIYIGNLHDPKSNEFSPKFQEIYKIAKGKRAVFYSNSTTSGLDYFAHFLDYVEEPYLFFDIGLSLLEKTSMLETFKQATSQCFLLLHPSYTEGVSILGAEQMHILEPIRLYSRKEQVIARVIRFQSHKHLEKQHQVVEIYQWSSSMNDIIDITKQLFASVSTWYNHNRQVLLGFEEKIFDRSHTPDEIIIRNNEEMKKNDNLITKLLTKVTERKCCITFPNKAQNNQCLEVTNNIRCDNNSASYSSASFSSRGRTKNNTTSSKSQIKKSND